MSLDKMEKAVPKKVIRSWYAVVTSRSLRSYLDHYRGMQDPALEPMPSEGPEHAKLSSSKFNEFIDYEEVLREAQKIAEIMTGAMKIQQGPGNLSLINIVAIYGDGTIEKFPPYGRPVSVRFSRRITRTFIKEGQVKDTIEKAITLFALRCENPVVQEVVRAFAQSDDWSGLYKIMETIRHEINEYYGRRNGNEKMVRWGWVSEPDLDAFCVTANSYRHSRDKQKRMMHLDEAQNLVGRVVEAWLCQVSQR